MLMIRLLTVGWMLEKVPRVDGSRCCLATHSSPNEFLTQVSIYWLTNIMSPFIRLYYEFFHQLKLLMANMDLQVPMGISIFKNELSSKCAAHLLDHHGLKFLFCRNASRMDRNGC
jgi:hypothetical protein